MRAPEGSVSAGRGVRCLACLVFPVWVRKLGGHPASWIHAGGVGSLRELPPVLLRAQQQQLAAAALPPQPDALVEHQFLLLWQQQPGLQPALPVLPPAAACGVPASPGR
jgi:hypothetical protein